MRLNLKKDITEYHTKWIKKAAEAARQAHLDHENAGGYTCTHALDQLNSDPTNAQASLNVHRAIELLRHSFNQRVKLATHENDLSKMFDDFVEKLQKLNYTVV